MKHARKNLIYAALDMDIMSHQEKYDELYLAAIAFAESIGYKKEIKPAPPQPTFKLIDTFDDKYLWECKDCGHRVLGDKRHNNFPTHSCRMAGHWTTPPYRAEQVVSDDAVVRYTVPENLPEGASHLHVYDSGGSHNRAILKYCDTCGGPHAPGISNCPQLHLYKKKDKR